MATEHGTQHTHLHLNMPSIRFDCFEKLIDLFFIRRAFRHLNEIVGEEYGGEEAFIDFYYGNYTEQLARGTLDTAKVCRIIGK